jgi:rhodanese-related sulfurtransferase
MYRKRHIPGAVSVPASRARGEDKRRLRARKELRRYPVKIVYADRVVCSLATVVAERLVAAGYDSVYVLQGGIEAWEELGLPVEQFGGEGGPQPSWCYAR